MLNKRLILGFTILTILVSVTFLGCSVSKPAVPIKSVPTQTQINTGTSAATDDTVTKPEVNNSSSTPAATTQLKYAITSIPGDTQIKFNTPWETSPLGKFKATIKGRGEDAKEEGYSNIIIKDINSGKLTKLTLVDETKSKFTTRDIEWIDESEMFVIIGQAFGTVSMGGKIYKINVTTGEISLYTDTTSTKEEYTAVHKTSTGYTFNKYIYEDANYTKGHAESGILHSK